MRIVFEMLSLPIRLANAMHIENFFVASTETDFLSNFDVYSVPERLHATITNFGDGSIAATPLLEQ
jgi:hypothetical protein